MHAYEVPRRQPLQPIPSARSAQDNSGGPSATPIYDALYAEWVRSFRTLPGDRSGEEELGFTAFGNIPRSTGLHTRHRPGSFSSSYSAYSAGAVSARQQSQWQRVGSTGQQGTGMHQLPAALPPGPRGSSASN
ncbi:hypothetical protein LXH13_09010 [Streptomyces spinosirectus]|uniref:hypothetical protein n=1 Tax=Streptomyces TaxID=1883 RepID=UPI000D4653C3|nr:MULTISPECIES: hypothetical protein [Streptomyces]MBY8344724.1 hypothetical protein [Streptomyces plumbidurans]PTM94896.1 hypothetical protein C7821_106438 [Streptomyces sp. VMFN-G11Ma]UIR17167.1 hypothetical protein LXH13_09010 [Streptomyces spinosirectus]